MKNYYVAVGVLALALSVSSLALAQRTIGTSVMTSTSGSTGDSGNGNGNNNGDNGNDHKHGSWVCREVKGHWYLNCLGAADEPLSPPAKYCKEPKPPCPKPGTDDGHGHHK
jgi:hypothetical protein